MKASLHPLEQEMGFLLDQEYNRYPRHSQPANEFFNERGITLDNWQRMEQNQLKANYFNLELYQEALKVVVERYQQPERERPDDYCNPLALAALESPPERLTLDRCLDDFLYLIVRDDKTGKWRLPATDRKTHESLRSTLDRFLAESHPKLEAYFLSNAPTGVHLEGTTKTFIYSGSYVSGELSTTAFQSEPTAATANNHAWVTRQELLSDYSAQFASKDLAQIIYDIAIDKFEL